ncbi:hypothetical protein C1H46_036306 [Malus baccata]|uniref:Ergosterol biosynthetic protein 28 n=1 Tax=Malus baccata TaxID=106549 RepID=A0A540KV97_MALBA|nr:hypothetical protein C1H46_036306 [Malus baccata]
MSRSHSKFISRIEKNPKLRSQGFTRCCRCTRFDLITLKFIFHAEKNPTLALLTEVHGRTFGVWTLLTCTLCYLCAFNLENKPLYLATFLSFVYALGHFLTEYLIYQTMAIANLSTVGFFAGTSIIWMMLQWNAHQAQPVLKSE